MIEEPSMIDTFSNTDVQAYIARGVALADAEAAQRGRMRSMKFDTIAVHGLYNMEAVLANQGSIIEPAFLSSAQHFENSDHMAAALSYQMPAWANSQIATPTLHYLEATLAKLENYPSNNDANPCVTA